MNKKLIATLGAAALAVCLLLAFLIWWGHGEAIRLAQETTNGRAATVAARLDATLRRIEGDLRYGAGNLPVAAMNLDAVPLFAPVINANMDRRKGAFPDVGGVRVFGADGDLLYTSDRQTVPNFNASGLPHFRQVRDTPDRLVISDVIVGRATGKPDVVLMKAVVDGQGAFRGAVAVSLNLAHFQHLIEALNLGSQGVVSIYRSDTFKLVMRQPWGDEKPGSVLPLASPLRQSIAAGKPGTLALLDPADGVRRIYSHQALEGYPFVLVAGVSRDEALASWFYRSLMVAVSALLLLALCLVLLLRLMRTEGIKTLQAAIIDNASDAIITRDQDMRILSWNTAAEQLFGFSAAEAIGQSVTIFIPPGREAEIARNRRLLSEGRPALDLETVRRTKDGRLIEVSLSQSPLKDDAGNVIGAALALRDISGRKLAEKALRSSEEKFATAFRASPMFMSISTLADGRYIDVSEGFLQFTGHAREDVVGRTSRDIGLWKALDDRQRAIDALLRQGRVSALEAPLCNKAGSSRMCEVWGDLIDMDGTQCVLWVVHDVSERKRLEALVLERERYFEALLATTPVGVFETDRAGKCRYVNRRWSELAGVLPEQAQGDGWLQTLHPDDVERVGVEWALCVGQQRPFALEYRFIHANGDVVWVLGRAEQLRSTAGELQGYIGAITNITVRKNAEAAQASLETQLRESQKMEAIGTLAGGIAHDFNNIIATILGNAALARQDVRDRPAEALESIEEIDKAGVRARALVQQILSFSRREPTLRKRTPLAGIVQETVRLLRSTLPARVVLDVACVADVPDAMVDPMQIEQVLINLATNAAQAMRAAPGRIAFELDCVAIDAELARSNADLGGLAQKCPGSALRLVVRDDGPGMPEHIRARIFEPFFTTKPVGEGTGLGLSVVHGIVRNHEGAILVASAPGQGAMFTIYLPAA